MTTLLRPVLLALFACTAQAQSVVDVAKCTIAANDRLPVGPELKREERACYNILGKNAQAIYDSRPGHVNDNNYGVIEHRVTIEVQQKPLQAAQPVHRYYPIDPGANAVRAPRAYPNRYPNSLPANPYQ